MSLILRIGFASIVWMIYVLVGAALLPEPAVAGGNPPCPSSWLAQAYDGPLQSEDYGHIAYQDFYNDNDDERYRADR